MSGDLAELSRGLGYGFSDPSLLQRAITHRSCSNNNYERLEFLGDSILNFIIAAELYEQFPTLSEGELTRLRADLVRMETLAKLARSLDLGKFLALGSGELKSGGYDRDSILADALEALFGAIFKDGDLSAARQVILHLYKPALTAIDSQAILKDPKTRLQEYLQKHALELPVYNILETSGDSHQQNFFVECVVSGLPQAVRGEGMTRRAAEQQAAARAYELLMTQDS